MFFNAFLCASFSEAKSTPVLILTIFARLGYISIFTFLCLHKSGRLGPRIPVYPSWHKWCIEDREVFNYSLYFLERNMETAQIFQTIRAWANHRFLQKLWHYNHNHKMITIFWRCLILYKTILNALTKLTKFFERKISHRRWLRTR